MADIPYTQASWRFIEVLGYPQKKDFGPYPRVFVALVCDGRPELGYSVKTATLREIGGDSSRPCFYDENGPLENQSWHAVAWCPLLSPVPPSKWTKPKDQDNG